MAKNVAQGLNQQDSMIPFTQIFRFFVLFYRYLGFRKVASCISKCKPIWRIAFWIFIYYKSHFSL